MKKIIFLILICSFLLHANELPELGSTFDSLMNYGDEKKIKYQIMQQVNLSNEVIHDPEINDYINNLGKELIDKGTFDKPNINFFIVNDSSINAFAMLGNVIGVHTGLLLAANSESELASVFGHEIAHITQKHLLRLFDLQARNSFKSYLALAVALLAARTNPQVAQGAITASSASQLQNILNYTRSNEREADRIGLQILDKAGYDPKGFIDFFSTMQKFNKFSTGAAPAFLRTHPVTTERISDIQDRLKSYKYIQKENKQEFYLIKAKLEALIVEYSEVSQYFKNQIDLKLSNNIKATYFGLVYALLRQNKIQEARSYFDNQNLKSIKSPMAIELNANLLIQEKKYEEAFLAYKEGINKYPYYRAFIFGISDLIIQSNQPEMAIQLLKSFLPYFDNDSKFYVLLSQAYSLNGDKLQEHESLSDAYYYKFDIQNAIIQMDLAVKTLSDNFYDQSRVEYRLKELKREEALMINQ